MALGPGVLNKTKRKKVQQRIEAAASSSSEGGVRGVFEEQERWVDMKVVKKSVPQGHIGREKAPFHATLEFGDVANYIIQRPGVT